MICPLEKIKTLSEFQGMEDGDIITMLAAIEAMVRSYTNNNFQNRAVRFSARSDGTTVFGSSPFLVAGDTVQISQSGVNDGVYTVKAKTENEITVDRLLFQLERNIVTKIEYPADVQMGAINLMKWEKTKRDKVGIKSETLSRHSVTYYDQDAGNQVMGYPVSLLGFLQPYMKARF